MVWCGVMGWDGMGWDVFEEMGGAVRYEGKIKGVYTRQGCAVDGDLLLEDVDDYI